MKFKNKIDLYFLFSLSLFIAGSSVFMLWDFITGNPFRISQIIPLPLLYFALFYKYFGTKYEIKENHLICYSLFAKEKITVNRIHSIAHQQRYFFGSHPATAKSGLLIKYQTVKKIYITPKNETLFIKKILELNANINVKDLSTEHHRQIE